MTIKEVTPDQYAALPLKHPHVFNTAAFSRLNAAKAERLHFLVFEEEGKPRYGITLGEREGWLLSPFSAPFGGFSYCKTPHIESLDAAAQMLAGYAHDLGFRMRISLPPLFYAPQFLAETAAVLSRRCSATHIELNYHFPVSRFADYDRCLARNARKNLRHAEEQEWEFVAVWRDDVEGLRKAFEVIRRNREEHGYRLSMTLAEVERTVKLIPADFFLLRHGGEDVAAAQVFHVADGIAQVVYWGDLHAYSSLRTMNMLVYRVFEHYSRAGLDVLDIGTSMLDDAPNYGLCDFKTSVGCEASPKFVLEF